MDNSIFNILATAIIESADSGERNIVFEYMKRKKIRKQIARVMLNTRLKKLFRRKVPKVKEFIEIIKKYPDDIFRSHFRMERVTFRKLVDIIKPKWKTSKTGRPGFPLEHALYMTLWFLANKNTYREVADRFSVARGSTYKIILQICKILTKMGKDFVKWPNESEYGSIIGKFNCLRASNSFPSVLGCVDGMHIPISKPKSDPASYYNRKGYFSLLLQGICDSNLMFTDVSFGFPGRCHDAHVWSSSKIGQALEEGTLILPREIHLLGDSAYPLRTYLLVPYRDNGFLSSEQKKFNRVLSSTRVCIEQAFGLLKTKFRILEKLNLKNISHARYIVMSCIVLHNIIITENKPCNSSELHSELCDENHEREELRRDTDDSFETIPTEAIEKRNTLCHNFQ